MKGATSQNWKSLAGSILRVNLDGTIPKDNPRESLVWAKVVYMLLCIAGSYNIDIASCFPFRPAFSHALWP
jgi:hypothetical protein